MPKSRKSYSDFQEVEIQDGHGGSVFIPSRGFGSSPEVNEASSLILMATNKGEDSMAYVKEDVVVALIRSRCPEDKYRKKQEILAYDDGEPFSGPLMHALWKFCAVELGIPEDTLDLPIGRYEIPKIEINIKGNILDGKSKDKSTEAKSKAA